MSESLPAPSPALPATLRLGTRPGKAAEARGALLLEKIRNLDAAVRWERLIVPLEPGMDLDALPEHDPEIATLVRAALLDGRIDAAVHAIKDLPHGEAEGIRLAAVPQREDPRECLLARGGKKLADLPPGARVGVDGGAREAGLLRIRPDLEAVRAAGPLGLRARRIETGELDGAIVALAAARRLGLHSAIAQIFGVSDMVPAAGQGAAAVEAPARERDLARLLLGIDHLATRWCVTAERDFEAAALSVGALPLGAYAEVRDMKIHLRARLRTPGGEVRQDAELRPVEELAPLGRELARKMLEARA